MSTSTFTQTAPRGSPDRDWGAGRVLAVVVGTALVLASLVALGFGSVGAIADRTVRDSAGFLVSPTENVSTPTYAVTSERIEIHGTGAFAERLLGDAKVTAQAPTGTDVFVGIAPSSQVDRFLRGVPHQTVLRLGQEPTYRTEPGSAAASAPTSSDIWVASSSGPGAQSITWTAKNGSWTIVVMNADGARGVTADVAAGLSAPVLDNLVDTLLWAGAAAFLLGVVVLAFALIRPRRGRRSDATL